MMLFWATNNFVEAHIESREEHTVMHHITGAPRPGAGYACKVVVSFLYYPLDRAIFPTKVPESLGGEPNDDTVDLFTCEDPDHR